MKSVIDSVERFLFHPVLLWLIGAGLALDVFTDPHVRLGELEFGHRPEVALGVLILSATCIASGAAIHRRRGRDEP